MSKGTGKSQITITILYGLPASGKTTYAKNEAYHNPYISVIDVDSISGENKFLKLKKLAKKLFSLRMQRHIILDGCFTTNDQVQELMNFISYELSDFNIVYKIVWWGEDRQSCLFNDKFRREISSENSINFMKFEKPNPEKLGILQKHFTKKRVVRKPMSVLWASKMSLSSKEIEDQKIRSSRWSIGGTVGHYMSDDLENVEGEPPLASFKEFDDLITSVKKDISFSDYKKIKEQCVKIESNMQSDYYGGMICYHNYVCDIKTLFDVLVDMNIVSISDLTSK